MMRRVLIIGVLTLAVGLATSLCSSSEAKNGPPTVVVTETGNARFYGPGPANLGLDTFNIDTAVIGTRTTTSDVNGTHTDTTWFDQFTLYDMVTGDPFLSCSASGVLSEDGVGIASDLQLATIDATALSMRPEGDPSTGADDSALCPGLSLRVLLDWHATGVASLKGSEHSSNCNAGDRSLSVPATSSGVTLNSPGTSPTVIYLGPSVEGFISRETVGRGKCD